MINWRNIKTDGLPTNGNIKYLVTDGKDISTSSVNISTNYTTKETKFISWTGDDNTWEDNQCCSGTKIFDLIPTHWCPLDEVNLPN